MPTIPDTPEPVYFVFETWDQPREGIALFAGVPHRFLCPFDLARDDYADFYLLKPIAPAALQLEREAYDLYFGHGPAPELPSVLPEPIPKFPAAKPRYEAIQAQLAADRNAYPPPPEALRARAVFQRREVGGFWTGRRLWVVRWTPVADPGAAAGAPGSAAG